MNIEKLEKLFSIKYESVVTEPFQHEYILNQNNRVAGDHRWVDYCDKYKILIVHPEWIKETFNENRKNMICIDSPENNWWLLVPKKFAEKCLVLGYLP